MLCTMVSQKASNILHAGNQRKIPDKDQHAHNSFQQVDNKPAFKKCLKQPGKKGGQYNVKANGQQNGKHYRNRHHHVHYGFSRLFGKPFFKPRRFFLINPCNRRRVRQDSHTKHQRIRKIYRATHKRHGKHRTFLCPRRQLFADNLDLSIGFSHSQSHIALRLHHNAFHDGLTADRRFLHSRFLYPFDYKAKCSPTTTAAALHSYHHY